MRHTRQLNESLTKDQQKAAGVFRSTRPLCLPGTNAIVEPDRAREWHNKITAKILELKLNPAQVKTFCDIAGVAE